MASAKTRLLEPRLGLSYLVKMTGTVVRGVLYARDGDAV